MFADILPHKKQFGMRMIDRDWIFFPFFASSLPNPTLSMSLFLIPLYV